MSTERETVERRQGAVPTLDSPALELIEEYEPDAETEARVLLMILGFPAEEIERVVSNLDSGTQM